MYSLSSAGIKDIGEAIKKIGETPLLEFKEQINRKAHDNTCGKEDANDFNNKAKARAEDVFAKTKAKDANFEDLAKKYKDDAYDP